MRGEKGERERKRAGKRTDTHIDISESIMIVNTSEFVSVCTYISITTRLIFDEKEKK